MWPKPMFSALGVQPTEKILQTSLLIKFQPKKDQQPKPILLGTSHMLPPFNYKCITTPELARNCLFKNSLSALPIAEELGDIRFSWPPTEQGCSNVTTFVADSSLEKLHNFIPKGQTKVLSCKEIEVFISGPNMQALTSSCEPSSSRIPLMQFAKNFQSCGSAPQWSAD